MKCRITLASLSLLIPSSLIIFICRLTGFPFGGDPVSRKFILKLFGMSATALVAGGRVQRALASTGPASSSVKKIACILAPEQTEGPYYIPQEKVRSDITEHKAGTPLQLRLTVTDVGSCKPVKGATVDIWHCDAGGIYSGFVAASTGAGPGGGGGPTDKNTFLRGIQTTNSSGLVSFKTIYPGWYAGRTVHIHVKVHVGGSVVHTGQLYFSDALTDSVYRNAPYKARAAGRTTRNSDDGIYANGGRQSTLSMRHARNGFVGSIVLGVKRG